MMKKIGVLSIGIILFLAVGVVATASTIPDAVNEVAKEKGINTADIQSVESVDYSDLPDQIDIDNIDKTNLEIYQVTLPDDKMFVLTFGGDKVNVKNDAEQKQLLSFGYSGEMTNGFLNSVGGVSMSADRGYVMIHDGSVTGMSTSLDVENSVDGKRIELIIYKNGKAINFGNEVSASLNGAQKDYDSQSSGVVTFEAGDTISVYAEGDDGVLLKDVITMVEISIK
jgi:hypothetical protein